jgi:hypothetical protein
MEQDNKNTEPELLSPSEKYKETQKQDWQIEALIIGSIIIGLTQVPALMREYSRYFSDFFGDASIAIETIITVPFIVLFIFFCLVLYNRIMWVIKFNDKNFDQYKKYDANAGFLLSRGLEFFVFLISGVFFYLFLLFLLNLLLTSFIAIFDIFQNEKGTISPTGSLIIKFLYTSPALICYISQAIIITSFVFIDKFRDKSHFINAMKLSNPFLFFSKSLTDNYFKKNNFKIIESLHLDISVRLVLFSILPFIFISILGFNVISKNLDDLNNFAYDKHLGRITIESDCFEKETIWLFVKKSFVEPYSQSIFIFNDIFSDKDIDFDNYIEKKSNTKNIKISLNDRNIENIVWIKCTLENEKGFKTFLNRKDFEKGYNKLIISKSNIVEMFKVTIYNP